MPPHKCSYFMCESNSEQKPMFRFPWKDANRLNIWLNNCGNMTIAHLPPMHLRTRYLCIDHFDKKDVLGVVTECRKSLLKTAVPRHYRADPETPDRSRASSPVSPGLKVLTPKRVYQNKKRSRYMAIEDEIPESNENVVNWSTPKRKKRQREGADDDTPKCKKLKTLLASSNKQIKRQMKKQQKASLNRKLNNKNVINISKHPFNSKSSKLLTKMQLRNLKSRKQWSNNEKKFCIALYYKSPAAYKFMFKSGIILAAPSTIQRWLQETSCMPGVNDEIFENIKNKFDEKPIKDRACALCFDEMSIMVDLEYNTKYDLIEGFEDFGGGERKPVEARYALVFIARGIYSNWKIPLAYFLSSKTVDAQKLCKLVECIINKSFDSGLLPKVIICDQATTNVKLIKTLGATVDYPFFFIGGRKIYSIFDAPHLIKNIRNNLINDDYELEGNIISFKDIISVYNIDKQNKSKSLKKLTPAHISPNSFQKMRVKLATQVLSNSVAGSIRTAIDSGELRTVTARHTADFVQICNDLFDCLNSKNKFDKNPFKCAITNNKSTVVNQTLIKSIEIFRNLKKIHYNKNNIKQLTRPPCFEGVVQTINAVLQLSAEELSVGTGVKFLITYKLNQDVIENLFGIYRIKGGCNKNPTSKSLRSMFRSNLLNNLIKFDNTNCESDQDIFLATQQNTNKKIDSIIASTSSATHEGDKGDVDRIAQKEFLINDISDVTLHSEELSESSECEVTLETCSIVYFAGWLGKTCIEKFNCTECQKILIQEKVDLHDKKQLLLINKTYKNIITPTLKSPSDFLFKLVNQVLDFYTKNITKLHEMSLIENLMQNIKKELNAPNNYHNMIHFDFLIKKLLQVKIHDYCKSRKKSYQTPSKLRILQNK